MHCALWSGLWTVEHKATIKPRALTGESTREPFQRNLHRWQTFLTQYVEASHELGVDWLGVRSDDQ
jgi:hypothetical protein